MTDTYQEGQHKVFTMLYGDPNPDPKKLEAVLRERKLTKAEKTRLYGILYAGPKR